MRVTLLALALVMSACTAQADHTQSSQKVSLGREINMVGIRTLVCQTEEDAVTVTSSHIKLGYAGVHAVIRERHCTDAMIGMVTFTRVIRTDYAEFPGHRATVWLVEMEQGGVHYYGLFTGYQFIDEQ